MAEKCGMSIFCYPLVRVTLSKRPGNWTSQGSKVPCPQACVEEEWSHMCVGFWFIILSVSTCCSVWWRMNSEILVFISFKLQTWLVFCGSISLRGIPALPLYHVAHQAVKQPTMCILSKETNTHFCTWTHLSLHYPGNQSMVKWGMAKSSPSWFWYLELFGTALSCPISDDTQ